MPPLCHEKGRRYECRKKQRRKYGGGLFPGINEKERTVLKTVRSQLSALLYRTGYLAGTQATGAGINSLGTAFDDCFHAFDIGLPRPIGTAMGVGNLNSERYILTADVALCHVSAPPLEPRVSQHCYDSRKCYEKQAFFCQWTERNPYFFLSAVPFYGPKRIGAVPLPMITGENAETCLTKFMVSLLTCREEYCRLRGKISQIKRRNFLGKAWRRLIFQIGRAHV